MHEARAIKFSARIILNRLIITGLMLAFSSSLMHVSGQPAENTTQGHGQGRRFGHQPGPASLNPNIYEAPLPPDMEGLTWDRKQLRGKIVVLDFWATWCAPCLNQIPEMKKMYDSHRREDLLLFGVNLDTGGNRSLRRWLKLNRNKVTWPQLFNRGGLNGALPVCYGIKDVPEVLIFNRQGDLAYRCKSAASTKEALRLLLADR